MTDIQHPKGKLIFLNSEDFSEIDSFEFGNEIMIGR